MSDITDLLDIANMVENNVHGHGNMPETLRRIAKRMETEAKVIVTAEAPAHPQGYADDGVAMMAHHKFSHALPWIIDMRRRGYSVELDLQVHVSKIGGTPEVDEVLGGLRFTKNVQVVL